MATTPSQKDRAALVADLGGTQLRVALVGEDGSLQHRRALATNAEKGPDAVVERLAEGLRQIRSMVDAQQVVGVGVAAPGPLDPWRGIVRHAPNLPGWRDVPLKSLLEAKLNIPTTVGNDANLAALGEQRWGAGMGAQDLVYLTVSTGIGSGIITGGRLLLGADGLAGEAGHMCIDPEGPPCNCGSQGCLETFGSGTAIARRAKELLQGGMPSSLSSLEMEITGKDVTQAAAAGDRLAQTIVSEAGRTVGCGVAGLVHLFNPSVVVVGGGVGLSGPIFWDALTSSVTELIMPAYRETLRLERAALGDDAGLLGAAVAVLSWEGPSPQPIPGPRSSGT